MKIALRLLLNADAKCGPIDPFLSDWGPAQKNVTQFKHGKDDMLVSNNWNGKAYQLHHSTLGKNSKKLPIHFQILKNAGK